MVICDSEMHVGGHDAEMRALGTCCKQSHARLSEISDCRAEWQVAIRCLIMLRLRLCWQVML